MFESLSRRIDSVLSSFKGKAVISQESFAVAMNTIRTALLDADVSLEVAKKFSKQVEDKVVGQKVIKRISPSKLIIKIFEDEIAKLLGEIEESQEGLPPKDFDRTRLIKNLKFSQTNSLSVFLMVGLQGCGKTTTSAKLAALLKQSRKQVMLASLDTARPAARQQLEILAKQIAVPSFPIDLKQNDPLAIAKDAFEMASDEGFSVLILDTAGRLHVDEALMKELQEIKSATAPTEILLVADALIGQEAVRIATEFDQRLGISGIILTRMDADSRGGAALSMRYATGKPVKFLGSGEKLRDLDLFEPRRVARRILGMGDVVSFVEKAYQAIDEESDGRKTDSAESENFTFDELRVQLRTLNKLGGIASIVKFIPGLNNMQLPSMIDDSVISSHIAIIDSMTPKERKNPNLVMNASRRERILKGSGTNVTKFNLLMNQFKQASKMVKNIKKVGIDKLKEQNILDMFSNLKKK